MARDHVIQKAEHDIQWLDHRISGLQVKSDRRSRLAAGCLDTALEHQKAIVLLIAKELHGSAFALIRIIYETYVRGVWLHRCASDADLEKFSSGRDLKRFFELLTDVEKLEAFEAGTLSKVKARSWKRMHGFTHTGFEQIVRRQTESTIEPNYDEGEILEALKFACAIGWLAGIAICDLAQNNEVASAILEKTKEIRPDAAEPNNQT